MTSREIIRRTLEYGYPERVARSFGDRDMIHTGCSVKTHATEWQEVGGGRWERSDEWGNLWARIDDSSKGEVVKGVLEDLVDLDTYEFPSFSRKSDFAIVKEKRTEYSDKWLLGSIPGFAFNIARKMRKLDQYLMDLLLEKERMHELHDRIDEIVEDMIRNYAAASVDGVMFWEDWGTQKHTLINPAIWREEFFPRFVKLCGIAHDLGLKMFMHSCGQIETIVPGLMEAGIDALQFDQPDLHGLDTLARHQEQNKITFWCPVDIQKTLQSKDESIIRDKAREMLDKLWKGRGGFIAGYYNDNTSIGLEPVWQDYACDEFITSGVQARYDSVGSKYETIRSEERRRAG